MNDETIQATMPISFEVNRWLADIRIRERDDQPVKVNAIRRKVECVCDDDADLKG